MVERQSHQSSPTHQRLNAFIVTHQPILSSFSFSFPPQFAKEFPHPMSLTVFIIAFFTVHVNNGFTAIAPPSPWRRINTESASNLFDAEQSSPWSIQEWSADFPDTLSTDFGNMPPTNFFLPSEEELRVVEKAVGAANVGSRVAESKLLENEFPDMKKKIRANVRETGTDSIKNYIKTMCNHELLNKNEEIILAREIQILLKWEKQREELENQLLRYVVLLFH
jgi:hypothetical protein